MCVWVGGGVCVCVGGWGWVYVCVCVGVCGWLCRGERGRGECVGVVSIWRCACVRVCVCVCVCEAEVYCMGILINIPVQ